MAVKVGIVGAGTYGLMHLRTFTQMARRGRAQCVGFVEINQNLRQQREQEFGVRGFGSLAEMIEKAQPEAVTVVTPDHMHKPTVLEAAAAGMHILCEKPMDTTEEGCKAMIDACKQASVLLQVDFHKRYDPDHYAAHVAVKDGAIGDPLYGSAHMEDRIEVPVEWFPHWAPSSSPAWFLGVHFYDVIRWIIGSEPKRVFASGAKKTLKNDYGVDTYDCINAKIDFENGCAFAFDVSWVLPRGFEAIVNQGCRIVGTKGVYEIDTQDRGTRACTADDGMRTYNNIFFREELDKNGNPLYSGYGVESIVDFIDNVDYVKENGMDSRPPGVWGDGFDGLQATRMALAAHKSAAENTVVHL